MTTPFPSPTDPAPRQFSVTGAVANWEPVGRWLRIGERHYWVAPGVLVPDPGTTITVVGHHERPSGVWVVTYITWVPGIGNR